MPAKDRKPKWKPARERINPVAITLRFDDDDGDDAGAAFAFADFLQHYREGEMAEALERLAELHRLVASLLMIHTAEANLYAGLSWEQIGQATGTTGQAAWQKWRYVRGSQDPIGTIRRRAKQECARTAPSNQSKQSRYRLFER
jgi:hypothetical protein